MSRYEIGLWRCGTPDEQVTVGSLTQPNLLAHVALEEACIMLLRVSALIVAVARESRNLGRISEKEAR